MPRISRAKERRLAQEAVSAQAARIEALEQTLRDGRTVLQEVHDEELGRLRRELDSAREEAAGWRPQAQNISAMLSTIEELRSELATVCEALTLAHEQLRAARAVAEDAEARCRESERRVWQAEHEAARLRREAAARPNSPSPGKGTLRFADAKEWRELLRLVHPDVHSKDATMRGIAERVTVAVLAARPA